MVLTQPGSADPLGPFDEPGVADITPPGPVSPGPVSPGSDGPVAGLPAAAVELDPLGLAERLSAGQLASMARSMRRRTDAEAAAAHRRRRLRVFDIEDGTGIHLDGDLFDDAAAAVRAALAEYTRVLSADPDTGKFDPQETSYADALVEMAGAFLSGRERATNRPAVVVHADSRILTGSDGWAETSTWAPLARETVRRLLCFCHVDVLLHDPDGNPLTLGRTQRTPTWQLAEAVHRRDGGCRFPGCRRRTWIQCHHIEEWDADFGKTDYTNLLSLCSRHHHLCHEGGWKIRGDSCGEMVFVNPAGTITLSSWPNQCLDAPGGRPPDRTEQQDLFATL